MRKIYLLCLLILSTLLVACNPDQIEAYVTVDINRDYFTKEITSVRFSNSAVYHYNVNKNKIQLQPRKYGNFISNINSSWDKLDGFELFGEFYVEYRVNEGYPSVYEQLNDEKISVYKMTRYQHFFGSMMIDEFYVINVEDIKNFDFDYRVPELE